MATAALFESESVVPRVRRFDEAHSYVATTTYDHASRAVSYTNLTLPTLYPV